jgi:hypothetical protein
MPSRDSGTLHKSTLLITVENASRGAPPAIEMEAGPSMPAPDVNRPGAFICTSRQKRRLAAMGRHAVDATAVAFGSKRDPRAVRRKRGRALVGRMPRQPNWLAAGHLLEPDVEIALAAAVGGVRDERSVPR